MVTAFVYLLLVALWSLFAAYAVLFMLMPALKKQKGHGGHGAHGGHDAHAPKPQVVKTAHYTREGRDYSTHEGFKSFAQNAELTVDDIVKGLSRLGK